MGLVVAAADVLLPLAETPAATGQASAPSAGIFASLLASLSPQAELTGEAKLVTGTASELPEPIPTPEQEKTETDPFAAIIAMAMPLQLSTKQPLVEMQPAEPAVDPTVGGVAAPAGQDLASAVESIETPPTEADEPAAAPATPTAALDAPESAPVVEAPIVAPGAPVQLSTQQPRAGSPSEAEAAIAAVSALSKSQPAVDSEAPPKTAEPAKAPDAPPLTSEAASVVRSVGNAETNTDGKGDASSDRKERKEIAAPRASATGIAHAAPNSAVGELRQATEVATVEPAPIEGAPARAELPQQVEQVARTVIERVETGGGEARIHLDPGDMGEVTIHVQTDGDTVKVEIRAERQEAMNLLKDHTEDLSSLLGERGLNLSDVNVGLGRGNSDQTWGQDSRPENRPATGEFASILGLDDGAPIEVHQRLRAAYNPDGAHLFRV